MKADIRSLFAVGFTVDEIEGIVGASLFGSFLAVALLHIGDLTAVKMLGATVGVRTLTGGAIMFFMYGLLLGLLFLVFVSGSINSFVSRIIMLSSSSPLLQKLLVPVLNVSPLGVTLLVLGAIYGVVLGIVSSFGVPLWLLLVGYESALPYLSLVALFAWLTYGSMMGLSYGLIIEQ